MTVPDALDRLINLWDFERAAEAALEPMAWRYFSGGAGDERTLRENRLAFERHRLRPRVLVDVGCRSLATTLLGRPTSWPVLVAPMAFHGLACGDAEAATARAAAAEGTVFCVSTMANLPLEQVRAAAPDARQWFQLYVQADRGFTADLVSRVEAAGYAALVVTVDAPLHGLRNREQRAERLRIALSAIEPQFDDERCLVSGSFGVTSTEESGYELRQLMAHADAALYRAKAAGRDRVMPYDGKTVEKERSEPLDDDLRNVSRA